MKPGQHLFRNARLEAEIDGERQTVAISGGILVVNDLGGCHLISEAGALEAAAESGNAELPAEPKKGLFNRGSKAAPEG